MSAHFLPRHKPWFRDGQTWTILRGGREIRSRTDYILGTDRRLIQNMAVRDARHNIYQYLVLGCICGTRLPHTHATLGYGSASHWSHQRPREVSNTCSRSSGGAYPGHLGGNGSNNRGSHWRPDRSSIPRLRHTEAGTATKDEYGHSSDESRRVSRTQTPHGGRCGVRCGVPPCFRYTYD